MWGGKCNLLSSQVLFLSHHALKNAHLQFANAIIESHGIVCLRILPESSTLQVLDKCYIITFSYSYTYPFLRNCLKGLPFIYCIICSMCDMFIFSFIEKSFIFLTIYSNYYFPSIHSSQFLPTPSCLGSPPFSVSLETDIWGQ